MSVIKDLKVHLRKTSEWRKIQVCFQLLTQSAVCPRSGCFRASGLLFQKLCLPTLSSCIDLIWILYSNLPHSIHNITFLVDRHSHSKCLGPDVSWATRRPEVLDHCLKWPTSVCYLGCELRLLYSSPTPLCTDGRTDGSEGLFFICGSPQALGAENNSPPEQ